MKRIKLGEIAVISHKDIDELSALSLIEKNVSAVINASASITGKYLNTAPYLLIEKGIPLIDDAGEKIFETISEGDVVTIEDDTIYNDGKVIGKGRIQTKEIISYYNSLAKENLDKEIEKFVGNTLSYIKKEKDLLFSHLSKTDIGINFKGKQILVVIRGKDYKKDLAMLKSYIRDRKPILIGVDGGADALIEFGYKPDIILGDMDSVSDKTLLSTKKLIVHAYENGTAPGLKRLESLGLKGTTISAIGTSEDLALILPYEQGAELIVVIGSHFSLEEFLSKGREGMSSTFLTRLRVGSKLIDAKGVNNLYKSYISGWYFFLIFLSISFPLVVVIINSPLMKQFLRLFKMLLKTSF